MLAADQVPTPSPGSGGRKALVYWCLGLGMLAVLGLFYWRAMLPVIKVRGLTAEMVGTHLIPEDFAERFGGERRAAAAVGFYLRLPDRLAPRKEPACWLLSRCGRHAAPAIRQALRHEVPRVREVALEIAGSQGDLLADAGPEVLTFARDGDRLHRYQVLRFLAKALPGQGRRSSPGMMVMYGAGGTSRRRSGEFRPRDAALFPYPDSEAFSRLEAVLPPWLPEAVSALRAGLGDESEVVRTNAAEVLAQLGPAGADAVPDLIMALGHADSDTRGFAAQTLGSMGPAAAAAAPALVKLAADPDDSVRMRAASALAFSAGPEDDTAGLLAPFLRDADPEVRAVAAHALLETRGEKGRGLELLTAMLTEKDAKARLCAVRHLAFTGSGAGPALPTLKSMAAEDVDPEVRAAAKGAVESIKTATDGGAR